MFLVLNFILLGAAVCRPTWLYCHFAESAQRGLNQSAEIWNRMQIVRETVDSNTNFAICRLVWHHITLCALGQWRPTQGKYAQQNGDRLGHRLCLITTIYFEWTDKTNKHIKCSRGTVPSLYHYIHKNIPSSRVCDIRSVKVHKGQIQKSSDLYKHKAYYTKLCSSCALS